MNTVVNFGEIMLRLKSPGSTRLFQEPALEATFGGGEANVAVSLARLGIPSVYVSAVPGNLLGDAVIAELRRHGVNTEYMQRREGRMGIYFLESGAAQRPSTVLYDRDHSAFSRINPGDIDWPVVFSGADWFHTSGITPALSPNVAEETLRAAQTAQKAGLTVSVDLNYRKKLWKYGKSAPEIMIPIVSQADILVANEEDIQNSLGITGKVSDGSTGMINYNAYRDLAEKVLAEFPNLSHVAVTLRESYSADNNDWSAVLLSRGDFHVSQKYHITDIVDRVGAGDAFSAGLIYAMMTRADDPAYALEFATAASCLKHTIPGDFNLSRCSEIEALMAGNSSGRIQR